MQMETSGTPVREEVHLSRRMCRWMAGLDTGIWGASLFLAWLIFFSALSRDFWWARLNVIGAFFFGDDVFRMGLSWATVAGAALLILLYSAVGAAMAQLAFTRGFIRNLFLGLILGTAWHIVAQRYLWRSIHPFGPAFFPGLGMLPGHLLFGLTLGRFARRFRAIAITYGDSAWVAQEWPAAAASLSASHAGPSTDSVEAPPVISRELDEAAPAIVAPSVEQPATTATGPSDAAEPPSPPPASPTEPPPADESQDAPVLPPLTLDDPSASAELPAGVSAVEPVPTEEGALESHCANTAPVPPTDPTASTRPAAPVDPASFEAPSSPAGPTPHQDPPLQDPNTALTPSATPPLPPSVPTTEGPMTHPSIPSPSDAPKSSSFSEPTASPVPPTKDGQNK